MNALRAALDALHPDAPGAEERLARFQAQLLNSSGSLVAVLADGVVKSPDGLSAAEVSLIEAAGREGVAVAGEWAAAALGPTEDGSQRVALHRLGQATALAQALARERLELVRAVGRCSPGIEGSGLDQPLMALASTARLEAATAAFAADVAAATGSPRAAVALFRRHRVVAAADSGVEGRGSEARRLLELAAGEVADSPLPLTAGNGGFSGLDRLAGGEPVSGFASLSEGGDGLALLLWPPVDGARAMAVVARTAPVAAARVTRAGPGAALDGWLSRLPWPASVPEADRPKLARRGLALLLGAILLVPVPDRVRAPVSIEPLVRRAVTAPLQARIDSVAVEPGDRVAAGQTLLVLDSVPTLREREDAQASLQAAATQAASARADGDVESERLAQLRAAQVAAQLAVLDARLEEAVVRAPIAGTVTGEDLRRRIGASVGRGELLFSIAAPGGYRAELRVADSDIQRVQNGARVRLALAAEPLSRRSATVIRIFPLAEVVDGRNMFRTIARIDTDDSEGLSAGMAGSGAIRAGYSPLAWQLLRGPVRWVRLKVWV